MASKVQMCNLALAKLGASRIISLDDNTVEAQLCNLLFNDIADFVMMEGMWATTIRRAVLAQTTNTPVFEWEFEFQLPTSPEALQVLAINEEIPGTNDYVIEGDKLLAHISTM